MYEAITFPCEVIFLFTSYITGVTWSKKCFQKDGGGGSEKNINGVIGRITVSSLPFLQGEV